MSTVQEGSPQYLNRSLVFGVNAPYGRARERRIHQEQDVGEHLGPR